MVSKPPAFLLYVNDLLASSAVDRMDSDQFRWYMTLLARAWHWEIPCHLPNDIEELFHLSRAKSKKVFKKKAGMVLDCFEKTADGKHLFNQKLLKQYKELEAKYSRRADAAQKRWTTNAGALHEQSNANQTKPNQTKKEQKQNLASPKSAKLEKVFQISDTAKDGRFAQFVDAFDRYWKHHNDVPHGFDSADGSNLAGFLKKNKTFTPEMFLRCLNFRRQSDKVNHGERFRAVLAKITLYASGPLDEYGKPKKEPYGINAPARDIAVVLKGLE